MPSHPSHAALAALLSATVHSLLPTGGGEVTVPADAILLDQRVRIDSELERNVASLERDGKLNRPSQPLASGLAWPLRSPADSADPGYYSVSAYVDHDSAHPGRILDWNCGTRSYDLGSGYNHAGVDIVLWPFPWLSMKQELVDIVAAAPGTIIGKMDANDDHSCPGHYSQDWNGVIVRHLDGTVAMYAHMKTFSQTTKPIGSTVATGEFLGKVGSSGFSNAPHLHFELRSAVTNYRILDPFEGACNASPSLWAQQRPYYDSSINKLATHSAPPDTHGINCPNPIEETPSLSKYFAPGSAVYFAAYYRDQLAAQPTLFKIIRPDGTTFAEWSYKLSDSTTDAFYNLSYWYWRYVLPVDSPRGEWHFLAAYQSSVYDQAFFVGDTVFRDGFE